MTEKEYLDKIDAAFPYEDKGEWMAAIDEGISISAEAAYGALNEICAAPPEVALSDLEDMVDYWSSRFDHPLKDMVLKMARAWLRGVGVPEVEILSAWNIISQYRDFYCALIVVAGPPLDWSDTLDEKYAKIANRWKVREQDSDGPPSGEFPSACPNSPRR